MRAIRHPLFWLAVALALVTSLLVQTTEATSTGTFDPVLYLLIGGSSFIAAVSIIVQTRFAEWTLLTAGLATFFLADALLWLYAWDFRGMGVHAHDVTTQYRHGILALIRAGFAVGCTFSAVGIVANVIEGLRQPRSVVAPIEARKPAE